MALNEILYTALLCATVQKLSFNSPDMVLAQPHYDYTKDPKIYYTTTELICADGYPAQEHKVVTDDGFILTVHRIPNGHRRPKVEPSKKHYLKIHHGYHPDFENCVTESLNETSLGIPVIMVHGVLMASDGWVLQGPEHDLAYMLSDAGYDVWMMNVRGNFYSRAHKTLRPSDPKFWDFSFHENAVLDVPNTIDYILRNTKHEKVFYVGISMGTTIFFTMTSAKPEYNDKILGFGGLAPVVFMKERNMNHRRKMIYNFMARVLVELKKRKATELFPRLPALMNIGRTYCSKGSQLQDFCYDLVSIIVGYHSKLVLRDTLHLYLTHLPTGTSLKTFDHYLQNIKGNRFKYYDYGPRKNKNIYGTEIPPDYPLWNITAPVALYYTDTDFYYDVKDEEELLKLLPNVVDVQALHKINHGDYLWSYNARDLVYNRLLSLFNRLRDDYLLGGINEIRRNRQVG